MNHPDESALPAYIDKLLLPATVQALAEWLKTTYPETFRNLQPQLRNAYRELSKPKKGL